MVSGGGEFGWTEGFNYGCRGGREFGSLPNFRQFFGDGEFPAKKAVRPPEEAVVTGFAVAEQGDVARVVSEMAPGAAGERPRVGGGIERFLLVEFGVEQGCFDLGEARDEPGGGSDVADQGERIGRLRPIFVEKASEVLGEEFGRFPEHGCVSGIEAMFEAVARGSAFAFGGLGTSGSGSVGSGGGFAKFGCHRSLSITE